MGDVVPLRNDIELHPDPAPPEPPIPDPLPPGEPLPPPAPMWKAGRPYLVGI